MGVSPFGFLGRQLSLARATATRLRRSIDALRIERGRLAARASFIHTGPGPACACRLRGAATIWRGGDMRGKLVGAYGLLLLLACAPARAADDVVVIDDVASWSHPTKDVFVRWKIKLTKVELLNHRLYPVFHVEGFPFDPMMGWENARDMARLESELFVANGRHDYALEDEGDHIGVIVSYDPAKRTLTEAIVDHGSEGK
jgi:hypothetical protein